MKATAAHTASLHTSVQQPQQGAQQLRWLLSYTAQACSGLTAWRRDTEHIQKAFAFAGMTARSGVTSALIVQSGWTGVDDIFSGNDNFFLAYAPEADTSVLIDGL